MANHPIDDVLQPGVPFSKPAAGVYEKTRVRLTVADAAEIRATRLSNQFAGIYKANSKTYYDLDTLDALTEDDLTENADCIRDLDGNAFKRISSIAEPTPTALGGIFATAPVPGQYLTGVDPSGNALRVQPSASDLSNGVEGTGAVVLKSYADGLIAAADAMVFKDVLNCSTNPNYPAADRGWTYRVGAAGKIGGASGANVEVGDILLCLTDSTASGDQATVGANWGVIQVNIDGAVTLTGTQTLTNKSINASNNTISNLLLSMFAANVIDTDTSLTANSDTSLATQKAVRAFVLANGGGGSFPDDARRNLLLTIAYQSKSMATFRRTINTFATGFKGADEAADGINAGASSNYTRDAANGRYLPSTPAATQTTGGTNIGGMTAAGGLAAAFDGNTSQADAASAQSTAPASGYVNGNATGKDWGSGNTKTITRFDVWAPTDIGFNGAAAAGYKLQGSTDNFASSVVDLASGTLPSGNGGTISVTSGSINTTTAYRYHRFIISGNGTNNTRIAELRFFEGGVIPNNMTLQTTAQTADAAVSNARVILEIDNSAAAALNVDLKVEVTCNGGGSWSPATLALVSSNGQNGHTILETADTACTAGTAFAARVLTFNNKLIPTHALGLAAH